MSGVYHFVYERYVARTKRILAINGAHREIAVRDGNDDDGDYDGDVHNSNDAGRTQPILWKRNVACVR